MTSKTWNLGDSSESTASCGKLLIAFCCLVGVVIAIVVAIYAYKGNFGSSSECDVPTLDNNGLSNWTYSAEKIAFACLPGYFLESHDNVLISTCTNGTWTPAPPACNFLPLRVDCGVDFEGLKGNISMWQKSVKDPAFLYGLVDYEHANREDKHLMAIVELSKANCVISDNITNVTGDYPKPTNQTLQMSFNSTELKAYNKAEVHINIIFVDNNQTASLVSLHQDSQTFVLTNSLSVTPRGLASSSELENYAV